MYEQIRVVFWSPGEQKRVGVRKNTPWLKKYENFNSLIMVFQITVIYVTF